MRHFRQMQSHDRGRGESEDEDHREAVGGISMIRRRPSWPFDVCGKKLSSPKNRTNHLRQEHGISSLKKGQFRMLALKRGKDLTKKKRHRSPARIEYDSRNQAAGVLPDAHVQIGRAHV